VVSPQIKISDFGLARSKLSTYLHTERIDVGTCAYMAPECFRGDAGVYMLAGLCRIDLM
jgi:serine/threonine protein kinase